jgi:hypothetical protein
LPKESLRGIVAKFNIALDQVTDDQVTVVRGNNARKILRSNPDAIAFFVWDGESTNSTPKGLMGIKQGTEFVSSTGYSQERNGGDDRNDPSWKLGKKNKGGYFNANSGIRRTTGSARATLAPSYGRRGRSGQTVSYFSASDFWSENVIVYIINPGEIGATAGEKISGRKENSDVFKLSSTIKAENQSRYMKALADIRSTENPELFKGYKNKLDFINALVNAAVRKILANPSKFRYSTIDKSVTYGSGRYSTISTTSLLKLVTLVYTAFDGLMAEYKSGYPKWESSYHNRDFKQYSNDIIALVNSINKTAAT